MHILKAHYKEALVLILILIIYFAFRLPNLTYQPIFADEAIYIRWAQIMKSEPTLRFISLSDGKTPLFMWIMMPMFKIFEDPLFAGRILAIFSGLGTLSGVYLIGRVFFNKRVALFGAFLIAITPYIVFFDRMALVDSMLAAFTVWSIFIAFLVVRFMRIDLAMVLGFLMGGGLLTKTPSILNTLVIPLTAITMDFSKKGRVKRVLKVFSLFVIAIFISQVIYNALRLGPGFSSLNSRNSDYVRDPSDLLKNPLDPFIPHLGDLWQWWLVLFGVPVIIALIIGIVFAILKKNRYAISLLLIALIPLVIQTALLRTFTARYLLFSMPSLLIITGFGLDNLIAFLSGRFKKIFLNSAILTSLLIAALLIWPIKFNTQLLTDIENAPLPKNERRGYLEDWTAGYGLREIASFLDTESKKGVIIVGTEGSFGTLPDGLQIYFDKNRNVVFKPGTGTISAELREEAKKMPTFFVGNEARLGYFDRAELLKRYPKALPLDSKNKPDAMVLYKINP